MKNYDIFIIGHVSLDEVAIQKKVTQIYGGAVLYASYAIKATGNKKVGVFTKTSERISREIIERIFNLSKDDIYTIESPQYTSIRNEYMSDDSEKRICTALSVAKPFKLSEIPEVNSTVYYLAGLVAGDFEESIISGLAKRGKIAADLQGFLRKNEKGKLVFKDWEKKHEYLPYIEFLKADGTEAEVITGYKNREQSAIMLHNWGAKEIVITHSDEILVYDGTNCYSFPLKAQNLSGRTGRGDTCFGAYVAERLNNTPKKAALYAAALTSLKLETPGPFKGTCYDVEKYIQQFYPNEKYD